MKLIKNDVHGVMYVNQISDSQTEHGWYEVTDEEVFGSKAPEADAQNDNAVDFDVMTKRELETYARDFSDADGTPIELDRRMSKKNMLKDFNEQLGD